MKKLLKNSTFFIFLVLVAMCVFTSIAEPALITTLGTQQIIRGVCTILTKGYPISKLGVGQLTAGTGFETGAISATVVGGAGSFIGAVTLDQLRHAKKQIPVCTRNSGSNIKEIFGEKQK